MPIIPSEENKSTSYQSRRKQNDSEQKNRSKPSVLDMPLPKPIIVDNNSLAQSSPAAAAPPPIVAINKPKFCGPRAHEYNEPSDDWGSLSVENYELGDVIGEGTFGQVFKATDRRTNRIVALKKVRLEKEKEGFPVTTVREIKILRQLNQHENIIKLRERHKTLEDIKFNLDNNSDLQNKQITEHLQTMKVIRLD